MSRRGDDELVIATGMTRHEITRGIYTATWTPGENKIDVWTDDGSLVDTLPQDMSWADSEGDVHRMLVEILDEVAFGDGRAS